MKITIVRDDNLVIIDSKANTFDLTQYDFPNGFWALQWHGESGEIELSDKNVFIDELPEWCIPIIEKHKSLSEEAEIMAMRDRQMQFFLMNGRSRMTRKNRKANAIESKKLKLLFGFFKRSRNAKISL